MSSRKLPVAINILPTLDFVELVHYDDKTGEIEKSSALPCRLDAVSRQVVDWELMSQTIRDLYSMNRIAPNIPAVLVLPSFFTREIELPSEFTREELKFALVSEAERFYVFKKTEPHIHWINLDTNRLLYSAYPKPEIEKYVQVFQENNIPLLGIELNYMSILRGLIATGAVQEEIETQEPWCLLVISDYTFFASIQTGHQIQKTVDAPISSSEDNDSSAIDEIQQDFSNFADSEVFSKLIVVNNANRLKSEDLLSRLTFQGNLILIEQNEHTLRSRGSDQAEFPCSLEGIGGVFYSELPELARLNFLPETSEDIASILHYRKTALKLLAFVNAGTFVFFLLVWGLFSLILWQKDQEVLKLTEHTSKLASHANAPHLNDLNRKRYVKKVVDQNAQINNFMVRLGRLTPTNTWIEKLQLEVKDINTPIQVTLEGKTMNLDEVTKLQTQLGEVLPNTPLEVSNAAPATSPDGQAYFTWTVQNEKAKTEAAGSAGSIPGRPGPGGGP